MRAVIITAIVMVVAIPMAAGAVWGFRRQAALASRVISMPDTAPARTFLGGCLSGTWSATWPLARLEFFDWGIRLAGSVRPVRWLIGTWEARYEELATVRLIESPASGVRLAIKGSTDAVVFWTFRESREISGLLEAKNVPVDRTTVPLRQAGGTYRNW